MKNNQISNKTFSKVFTEISSQFPNRVAVVDCVGSITYAQLEDQSNAIAHEIHSHTEGSNAFVALILPRRKEFVAAALAVQKAGCAYVPISDSYPVERINYILNDCKAGLVLTTRNILAEKQSEAKFNIAPERILFVEDIASCDYSHVDLSQQALDGVMIYTSGSTGKPKGVLHTMGGAFCMANEAFRSIERPADDVMSIAMMTDFAFIAHLHAAISPLLMGGCTHILDENTRLDMVLLYDYLCAHHITDIILPSRLGVAMANEYDLPVKNLYLVGEKISGLKDESLTKGTSIYSWYGMSECLGFKPRKMRFGDDTDFGEASDLATAYVLDDTLLPVADGETGNLYICSDSLLCREYFNMPELTAERFVDCPFEEGKKMFNTCDRVRRSDVGYQYVGRADNMVKLNGLRIETGEVENVAQMFDGIEAAVCTVQTIHGSDSLLLYYQNDAPVDEEALKIFLSKRLAAYMVPMFYMHLQHFPLNARGKVDRSRMPAFEATPIEVVAPATPIEQQLFDIASALLGTDDFGVTTNLISAGINSLSAMKLCVAIRQQMGASLHARAILTHPTLREIAALLSDGNSEVEEATIYERQELYPITENQRGVYIDWEMNRTALQYNLPSVRRFTGVTAEDLAAAVRRVIDAHPGLKAHLSIGDDVMQQRRDEAEAVVDIINTPTEPDAAYFQQFVRPFNLLGDDLYRVYVVQSPSAVYLFTDFHHVVFDGTSGMVIATDIDHALRGEPLAAETYTMFDHAISEQKWMESEAYREADTYFSQLTAEPEIARYPHSSENTTPQQGLAIFELKVGAAAIDTYCKNQAFTPNSFFMTVFAQALHRLTREDNLLFVSVNSGRGITAVQDITGMFVKTLPVASSLLSGGLFSRAVANMQKQFFDTTSRDTYPYSQIVQKIGGAPEIMFVYQGGLEGVVAADDSNISLQLDTVKFPLTLMVYSDGHDSYILQLKYDSQLYSEVDMARLGRCLVQMSTQAADANCKAEDMHFMSESDEKAMIDLSYGGDMPYDTSLTWLDHFHRQVESHPDSLAVADIHHSLTYRLLDEQSDTLAHMLVDMGIQPDSFVCLLLERTVDFPLSFIAVHKAAAAYTPLDVEYPIERLQYMLTNSESKVLITTHAVYDEKSREGELSCEHIIFIDDVDLTVHAEPVCLPTPKSLAYMIYTSGSTGLPKGTLLHHRGLLNFSLALLQGEELTSADRTAAHRVFSFDAHIGDWYPTLCAGGQIHIMPSHIRKDMPAIHDFIVERGITGTGFTTSLTMMLLKEFSGDLPLRFITAGGEKLTGVQSDKIAIINLYGPTECTNDSTYFVIPPGSHVDNIPIGRAVPNTWCFVVAKNGQLLPQGVAGELCLVGPQVGYGYWHLPEKTREVFTECPFMPGRRMYHTGDLVRYNESGQIEYLGRIDNQVKLRGYRIEMGEIEQKTVAFPLVEEAAAKVVDVKGTKHLALYVTAKEGAEINPVELKQYLDGTTLAKYMMPDVVVVLPAMPRLPNGKVDRRHLPVPEITSQTEYEAPATPLEQTICDAFANVLSLERVGATDDFFMIGGSSLVAMRLVIELGKAGHKVVYADVFDHSTPRSMAEFLGDSVEGGAAVDHELIDFDYSAINDVLSANTLEAFHKGERQQLGRVLLTGSTGYLGIHILRELLQHDDCTEVVCMARGTRQLTPEAQLRSLLFYYFDDTFDAAFDSHRISVVKGDVTEADTFRQLESAGINTVINCAAVVKHFAQGTLIEDVNVGGVERIIGFCLTTGARMVHISTTSVAGMSIGGFPDPSTRLTENKLFFGQNLNNKYIHSKFLADRAILQAIATQGLNAKIMRVRNLSARDRDGEFQINLNSNAFMGRIRVMHMLGCCTYEQLDNQVELSPIDMLADAIIRLASTPRECCLFHPFNSHLVPMSDVVDAMNKLNIRVEAVEATDFAKALDKAKQDPNKAEVLSSLLAYDRSEKSVVVLQPSNNYTLGILHRLGFAWPQTSADYMQRFLSAIASLGFFDE